MFYPRKIYPALKNHLSRRQITVLTGIRRSGKTTIIKQLLSEIASKNKIYLDLQRADNRELFSHKNFDNILLDMEKRGLEAKKKLYIFLDEIQLAPELPGVLKYLYDHHNIKFVVTGSSSYYLKNLFTESLSGRKKIFELFPLDFGEFLAFKKAPYKSGWSMRSRFDDIEYERLTSYYEEFIEFGGFPEVVLTAGREAKNDLLNDILNSYIRIDIASLADFRKKEHIYQLIKLLAARVGTRLDYAKLSRLIGLSKITMQNYLDFFEQTYLISRLPVFTKNRDREIVKAKKLYFCDTGFLNILADLDSGTKFENAVFTQLRQKGELRYYAIKTGREIDFVLDNRLAIETKETPIQDDLRELKALSQTAGIGKSLLIGRRPSPKFQNFIWGGEIK